MLIIAAVLVVIMLWVALDLFLQSRKRTKIEYWNARIQINDHYISMNERLIREIREYFKDDISEQMQATLNRLQKCINQAKEENVELLNKLDKIQK